ncbi:MAG: 50S ribosomal protein L13 [Gemmatimonadota bacterium]
MTDRTYSPKAAEIDRRWYVVDADGKTLGRLATQIASVLRGKHKPTWTPHMDMGDHVVVVNAEKVRVTGRKAEQKTYYRYTGYPGGIRSTTYAEMLADHPERILQKAVWGMLPHNVLGRQMYKKLRVYAGPEHRHAAQQPEPLEL